MKKIIVGFKVLTYITFYLFYLLPTLLYLRLKYGKGNADAKKNDKYFEILIAPSVNEFIKYYILMILIIIMIVKIIKSIY
jgi:hypothetical protein